MSSKPAEHIPFELHDTVPLPQVPGSQEELLDWARTLTLALTDAFRMLNWCLRQGLEFDRNFNCTIVDVTTPGTADTEFSITHGLIGTPAQFIVLSMDKAAIIYKGATAWTGTTAYLKANQASVVLKVLIAGP